MIENFSNFDPKVQIFLITILALIFGSFASLVSYRLANNQPIIFTRSKCTNCGTNLGVLNLIPLISWIIQLGKCSKCHHKISIRYPLIELGFVVSFLMIYFSLDQQLSYKMLLYFGITGIFIVMSTIDIEKYFIPDSTQYALTILVTLLLISEGSTRLIFTNIAASFLYIGFGLALFGFFYITTKVEALGIDDLKFLFIIGLLLGTKDFLSFMLLSGVFGTILGIIWQKVKNEDVFPFAPSLCLSAFLCMLFDKKIDPIDVLGSLLFF